LGLPRLESVAHAGENILGKFRSGELVVTPEGVSLILECLDRIRSILSILEQTEAEPEGEDSKLIARLNAAAEGGNAAPAAAAPESVESLFDAAPAEVADEPAPDADEAAQPEQPETAAEAQPEPEPVMAEPKKKAAAAKPAEQPKAEAADKESAVANQSIRVNVDLLENLMTMVSELVLTRNQLLQILRGQKDSEFAAPLQRLNHVVSELQEGVMKTRMQPIGNAWAKLPRIIRDLSLELGKKIDLVMKGAETELDRQVLELIKDPLTHMVRNSADHGLESTADRVKAGKPEVGKVTLEAFHQGGHIIIRIADDGRGLSAEKIKKKAIESGLATESELDAMTEQQIQRFIFKAGFSTAAKVTSVSGRGVGMDVVRTNIEKIGGTIELNSVEGKGTSLTIKIPLTLAIVSALIVECGGERFAVPQISVLELVRAASNSENTIERINGTPVLRLRNRLLPLVSLRALMHLGGAATESESITIADDAKPATDGEAVSAAIVGKKPADQFIVVTQVGSYTFGIIVDRVFDTEEIVVKPVAPILREISMFSGNTILGDGGVVMILDTNGIASAMGEGARADVSAARDNAAIETGHGKRVSLLVFRAGEGAQKSVPLSVVARLEEIDVKTIEFTDGKPIVQYRGKLMPLVPIAGEHAVKESGRQPVVVFADEERSIGLLVDEIVDIVDQELVTELSTGRPGFIGTAVIAGVSTEIIDAGHYAGLALKDWFARAAVERVRQQPQVLLIDDSPFFRNLICPLLAQGGYEVTPVASAEEALALCAAGRDFDLIVSDLELPGMSGLE
ncbi:MAG: chemotaxis protein CheW, partial [Pseudomonadota bacterium]